MAHVAKRDHFVSRFHIRQFCNNEGRVFCFDKQKVSIPERTIGNCPKDILFGRSLYKDDFGDLDRELYKPIEDSFAPHLVRLVRSPEEAAGHSGFGKALIDWIAAQCTKTTLVKSAVEVSLEKDREGTVDVNMASQAELNHIRIELYKELVRLMDQPKWKWKLWKSDTRRFVLGDHPICNTTPNMAMGFMLFVPLTPSLMLCGGSVQGHEVIRKREILHGINGYIASWCERFVYSCCLEELESLVDMMQFKNDPEHDLWIRYAKNPHHGIAQRITENEPPAGFNYRSIADSFS